MAKQAYSGRVGEIRPSQLMFSYGVGASMDLPHLTVLVMGLDSWPLLQMDGCQIAEERLRLAVRRELGAPIERLLMPPPRDDDPQPGSPSDRLGVPVAPFPRWLRCPQCDRLASINSGTFELKPDPYRPDRTRYVHAQCTGSRKKSNLLPTKFRKVPTALPARFLLACKNGHIDDFPWVDYAHNGVPCASPLLYLSESGTAGDAASIYLACENCKTSPINMSHAFTADFGKKEGKRGFKCLCRGRHPHLGNLFEECETDIKTIILGASNSWFPITMSAFSIPESADTLGQLVEENWAILSAITQASGVAMFRAIGQLKAFSDYTDEQLWEAIETKRVGTDKEDEETVIDLKTPEWEAFSSPAKAKEKESVDFKLREVASPQGFEKLFERVVLVERLREVHALLGFTRIESPADIEDATKDDRYVPLARDMKSLSWVPAVQVRGEGIFLQINEAKLREWCGQNDVVEYDQEWQRANRDWRESRGLVLPDIVPNPMHSRYTLLHSLSHALMRRLCLECGYSSASIRERIYSQDPDDDKEPQAGILIYTAAPDAEGTLGGLVSLGEPQRLGLHLRAALEEIRICASDPICSEHTPGKDQLELHGSACHACLFAPETSCEKGNKFLDRAVLVKTFDSVIAPFFPVKD